MRYSGLFLCIFLEQEVPGVLLGERKMPGQGLAMREVTLADEVIVDEWLYHQSMKEKCEDEAVDA